MLLFKRLFGLRQKPAIDFIPNGFVKKGFVKPGFISNNGNMRNAPPVSNGFVKNFVKPGFISNNGNTRNIP